MNNNNEKNTNNCDNLIKQKFPTVHNIEGFFFNHSYNKNWQWNDIYDGHNKLSSIFLISPLVEYRSKIAAFDVDGI